MNKPLALLWSMLAIAILVSVGAALSYQRPWLALLCAMLFIFQVGAGFIIKARLQRKR